MTYKRNKNKICVSIAYAKILQYSSKVTFKEVLTLSVETEEIIQAVIWENVLKVVGYETRSS